MRSPLHVKLWLIQAMYLLIFSQLCVSFLSLPILIKLFRLKTGQVSPPTNTSDTTASQVQQVYWLISTVRRIIPFMTFTKCLAQALTARILLKKNKVSCVLFIGAKIKQKKLLEAHAWLTCDKITMNFGADDKNFTELIRFY